MIHNRNCAVSIQLGELSNAVNAHLWNLRKSSKSSFYYQDCDSSSGTSANSEPQPRTLIIDDQQAFHNPYTSSSSSNSYLTPDTVQNHVSWVAGVDVHRQSPAASPVFSRWSDWMEGSETLPDRCRCPLPTWMSETQFDTFGAGLNTDLISSSFIEDCVDQFRQLAEACDRLSAVIVIADVYSGYGGLLSTLLEDIRQDLPHAAMPVFAITSSTPNECCVKLTKNSLLRSLNIPLVYAKLCETASVVIPLHTPATLNHFTFGPDKDKPSIYRASAVIASAIHTVLGPVELGYQPDWAIISTQTNHSSDFHQQREKDQTHEERVEKNQTNNYLEEWNNIHESDTAGSNYSSVNERMPIHEWCSAITSVGRQIFARMEVGIPSPLFQKLDSTRNGNCQSHPLAHYFEASQTQNSSLALNPFLHSLSTVDSKAPSLSQPQSQASKRAYSNLVSFRGPFVPGTTNFLYERCVGTPYMLSTPGAMQVTQPFRRPHSFPCITSSTLTSTNGFENNPSELNMAAAVGSNVSVGEHIEQAAAALRGLGCAAQARHGSTHATGEVGGERVGGSTTVFSQLERCGLDRDECVRLVELLAERAARY